MAEASKRAVVEDLVGNPARTVWGFGAFQLDSANELLRRGRQKIALKPKAFAVLRYLVEHPGRLITKDELLSVLWPDVHVGDAVLKTQLKEVRSALGDDARTPQPRASAGLCRA